MQAITLQKWALLYSAGTAGALVNTLLLWALVSAGIVGMLGVSINPPVSASFLYPRLVWGGLWGFIFCLPLLKPCARTWVWKGLLASAGPILVQLAVVFPYKAQKGMWGAALGEWTFAVVIIVNAAWGLSTAYLLYRASK